MLKRTTFAKYAPYGVWVFFAFFCFRYALEISSGGDSWKTADWLINYSAGPLRRGLTGTILLALSDLGLPLLWLTYVFQVSIYAVIFIVVLELYKQRERGVFWLLILYSPAFLLFSFYDFQGGFRKEIIIFSIFAYFCLLYSCKTITQTKLVFISIGYVFAGLSHELTVFTLPFFVYLLFISAKQGLITERVAVIYSAFFAVASTAILMFATLHKGDVAISEAICQSLINRHLNPDICVSAITWLGTDSIKAASIVLKQISYVSLFTPILFVVAVAPLFFTTWWKKQTYVLLTISIFSFSPLFITAIDWGRWVYILTFMLFCLALAEEVTVRYAFKNIYFIAGFFYLTTWFIPHCCVGGFGKGFFAAVGTYAYKTIEIMKQ
jgi:hypothetical protein